MSDKKKKDWDGKYKFFRDATSKSMGLKTKKQKEKERKAREEAYLKQLEGM